MYGSNRQSSRSWLGDILGFDPTSASRNQDAYGFDIERTDDGFRIEVPVAGFRPEDINVTVEDRVLTIEGRGERRRFARTVTLPDEIDTERIDAHVEHGLLTLVLRVHPKAQPRRIEVRVGGQQTNLSGSAQSGSPQSTPGNTVSSVSGETQGEGTQTPQQSR
jgi:HSP20 family protein